MLKKNTISVHKVTEIIDNILSVDDFQLFAFYIVSVTDVTNH